MNWSERSSKQLGFSLIELLIAVLLSGICSLLLYRTFYQFTQQSLLISQNNERQVRSQQLAYWLEHVLARAGQYNFYDDRNKATLLKSSEYDFVTKQPIALAGSYQQNLALGSTDGDSDTIVFNLLSSRGCNGQKFNYSEGELFHLVEEIYLEKGELRCRSYDGRYLVGITARRSIFRSVGLVRGIAQMQVKYLVRVHSHKRFVDASQLNSASSIEAIKLEIWLQDLNDQTLVRPTVYSSWLEPGNLLTSKYKHQRLLLLVPLLSRRTNV